MRIYEPCIITPRLRAGLSVGGGFLSIDYSPRPGRDGRTRYVYAIDVGPNSHEGDDMQSGRQGGDLQSGLVSLLHFLLAAAEEYEYEGTCETFPIWVAEWVSEWSDELSLLAHDIEHAAHPVIQE